MTSYVSAEFRRLVLERSGNRCEYCLIHSDDTIFGCQVDHIISENHFGVTNTDNLAMACAFCNRFKGTDIGSIAVSTREFTRFFNPRTDRWNEHFRFDQFQIASLTPIGEVTLAILQFNHVDRVLERQVLHLDGRFPPKPHPKTAKPIHNGRRWALSV